MSQINPDKPRCGCSAYLIAFQAFIEHDLCMLWFRILSLILIDEAHMLIRIMNQHLAKLVKLHLLTH